MYCPHCEDRQLSEFDYQGVTLERCNQCEGVWFDAGELNKVISVAASGVGIPDDIEPGDRICPKCDVPLYKFKYPQTYCYVDMCKNCHGLWFDTNELKEVVTVRESFQKKGKLEEVAEPVGIKADLINFVNQSIDFFLKGNHWGWD